VYKIFNNDLINKFVADSDSASERSLKIVLKIVQHVARLTAKSIHHGGERKGNREKFNFKFIEQRSAKSHLQVARTIAD